MLAVDEEARAFFDAARAQHADARRVAAWVVNELPRVRAGRSLADLPFQAAELAKLLDLAADGTLNPRLAKQVLEVLAKEGGNPAEIADARGWKQFDDEGQLAAIVDQVVADHADQVARYRTNPRLLGFFVGQVMKATGGSANGQKVQELLRSRLDA